MHVIRFLVFVLLACTTQFASAQSQLNLSFSSEPASGVLVTPRLTGALPGCPPERAELVLDDRYSGVLRVYQPEQPRFCGSVQVDSDLTLPPVVFPNMGIYTIRIIDDHGLIETMEVAVQGLVVHGQIGTFARYSVNGTWYSPEHSGSGLVITHQRGAESESTFGVWFNFDGDGQSQWHSLQEGRWITPSLLSGTVYKSRGRFQDCGFAVGDTDCPESLRALPAHTTENLGRFEMEMLDNHNALLRFVLDSGVRHEVQLRKLM